VRRILYRLPEWITAVQAGERVLLCEGERDADTAVRLGYAATTAPGGINKWAKEYDEFLRGADVVIVSDNDAQEIDPKTGKLMFHPNGQPVLRGQDYAAWLTRRLRKIAAQVRMIIPPVKDLSAWIEAGGTREALDELILQAPDQVKQPPQPEPQPPPIDGYMDKDSNWACNVGNVLRALERELEIMNAFGFDEMLRCVVLLRPLFSPPDANFKPRPITDADVCAVQTHLQWLGFRRLGKDATHEAIDKHARDRAFHPVRNYLDGLRWDGEPRLAIWLARCFDSVQSKYTAEIGKMFLISMVARIFKPGCKVDHMLILEGKQGKRKSTACQILAGDYFTDQLPDITNKEAFQHLRGKWLIEVAELQAYSRAAVDHFKAFLVRDTERYRPPWGRNEVHEQRQCCFIGTTNKAFYLKDPSGNRRFWPLKTGEIDLNWLRANRDQLFAEAVKLYRDDVQWWPDENFEEETIRPEQDARYQTDVWEGPIKIYLDRLGEPKETTILNVAIGALEYEVERPMMPKDKDEPQPMRGTPINRLSPRDEQRIAAVLMHLKWEPKRDMKRRWWGPIDEKK
jgi:hypothetical protein